MEDPKGPSMGTSIYYVGLACSGPPGSPGPGDPGGPGDSSPGPRHSGATGEPKPLGLASRAIIYDTASAS